MAKNIRLVTRSGEIGYPKTTASQVENLDNAINTAIGSALQSANYVNESTVDSKIAAAGYITESEVDEKIAAIEHPVDSADVTALEGRVAALEGAEFPTEIPATTELANNKTYSLKFINGALTWVKDDFVKFGVQGPLTKMINDIVDLGITASGAYSVVSSNPSIIAFENEAPIVSS